MGTPDAERLTEPLNPLLIVVVPVENPRPFCGILRFDGEAETVKVPDAVKGNVKDKKLSRLR